MLIKFTKQQIFSKYMPLKVTFQFIIFKLQGAFGIILDKTGILIIA